jgi:hypothetical protein
MGVDKMTDEETEIIPAPEEPEGKEPQEFDEEEFKAKLALIREILDAVTGGETVGARVSPILSPKNPKTTSILNRGEISMCLSLIEFAKLSPRETYPALDYVLEKLAFNLSLDGRGIELGIKLGQALTQRDASTKYLDAPSKPTEGMKK